MDLASCVVKAKGLFAQAARSIAALIVGLACAVNAHATSTYTILPTGNLACSSNTGGSCSGAVGDASLSPSNGIQGVSFFTLPGDELSIPNTFGLETILSMSAGGTLNGTLSGNVPVSWDFTLSTVGGTTGGWELYFYLGTVPGDNTYGQFIGGGVGDGTFIGSGSITVLGSPSTTLYETVGLQIGSSGTSLDITAPFDFGGPRTRDRRHFRCRARSSGMAIPPPKTSLMRCRGTGP